MNPDPNTNPNPQPVIPNPTPPQQPQTSSIVPELANETPMSLEKIENPNPTPVTPQTFSSTLPPLNTTGSTSFLSQPQSSNIGFSSNMNSPISTPSQTDNIVPTPTPTQINPVEEVIKTKVEEPAQASAQAPAPAPATNPTPSQSTTSTISAKPQQMIAAKNNQSMVLIIAGVLGVLIVLVGGVLFLSFSSTPSQQVTQAPVITEELVRETQPTTPARPAVTQITIQEYLTIVNGVKSRFSQIKTTYPINILTNNINVENVKSTAEEFYSIKESLESTSVGNQTATQLNGELTTLIDQFAKLHDEIIIQLGTGTSLNPQVRSQIQTNYTNLNNSINAKLNEIPEKLQTITIQ